MKTRSWVIHVGYARSKKRQEQSESKEEEKHMIGSEQASSTPDGMRTRTRIRGMVSMAGQVHR